MYYSIMKIYQIYYNKETFSRLDEEFIPYDNKKMKGRNGMNLN